MPSIRKLRIHKGGRPRKDRPSIDLGTPESIAKRFSLSPDDPTMSTCPLDILLTRRLISQEAYSAATFFRSRHKILFGSPHPKAVDLNQASGPDGQYDEGEAEADYRDACAALNRVSRRAFDIVENIVIHERTPSWLMVVKRGGDVQAIRRTREAFAILLAWHTQQKRQAA